MNGSIWRKWDLHLHTPKTKLSDNFKIDGKSESEIWAEYCDIIEKSDVSVFGITDYFCCENYFEFITYHKAIFPLSKKIFFLNIEFRLPIAVNKQGEEVNIHILFDSHLSKSKIDEFLMSLKTHSTEITGASIKCKNLSNDNFVSATVSMEEINRCLLEVFGNSKPYLIVAAANNAGLRPTNSPRKLSITDEIDKSCDAFFGGIQNKDYYLLTNRYEDVNLISKPKPVLSGCDAHSFEDLNTKLGKRVLDNQNNSIVICDNTWIKSDPTFEGLKQVLYEPKHRITIQENEPRYSTRRIESIKFNFPNNIKISRKDSNDIQEFCLKNISNKMELSNYFTCLVGGRGTGKSTIINLIAEKLKEKSDFFQNNNLLIDNKIYNLENDQLNIIEIKGTNEIEFVSQGKIEKLAEGNKLTNLVFNERIKNLDSQFENLDKSIISINETIDSNIKILEKLNNKIKLQKVKKSEKETNQKIIDSVNDEEYKTITSSIAKIKNELNSLTTSKSTYIELLKDIKFIVSKYKTSDRTDEYASRYNELVKILNETSEIQEIENETTIVEQNFDSFNEKISKLNQEFDVENSKLKDFFLKKGTSEEIIKDSQNANEKIARLNQEILDFESEMKLLAEEFKSNELHTSTYESIAEEYQQLIKNNLEIINAHLDIKNDNLLKIHFETFFDSEKFYNEAFEEFYNYFSNYHISGTSKNDVKRSMLEINLDDILSYDFKKFKEEFESRIILKYNRSTNYIKIIDEVFKDSANFVIYKLIIKKHKYNIPLYIKFKGFYGGKDLRICSFGQRCTAVVVTLLMTGIKPLIVDEPEAHLDNKLIAEYLVELIKSKKLDRQIIFATHNSNFVINGDSELIHILDIPHNDVYTNITSTTIENTFYRDKLLRLEGGKEAFKTRENKYNL